MKGDRADRIEQSVATCREAYVKQQKGVPDQTALVWRWHLGALLECSTRLKAILARNDDAALSPQTLPAPGEVDHIADAGNMVEVERIRRAIWRFFSEQDEAAQSLSAFAFLGNRDDLLAQAIALATVAAANDEGDWVLVPREITQAMLDATCATDADDQAMRAAWSELIRTAPKPHATSRSQHEGASS